MNSINFPVGVTSPQLGGDVRLLGQWTTGGHNEEVQKRNTDHGERVSPCCLGRLGRGLVLLDVDGPLGGSFQLDRLLRARPSGGVVYSSQLRQHGGVT